MVPHAFELRKLACSGKLWTRSDYFDIHDEISAITLNSAILEMPIFVFKSDEIYSLSHAVVSRMSGELMLPFQKCVFECEIGGMVVALILCQNETIFNGRCYLKNGRVWGKASCFSINVSDTTIDVFEYDDRLSDRVKAPLKQLICDILFSSLFVLNKCGSVTTEQLSRTRSQMISAKRGVFGHEYKVVSIDKNKLSRIDPRGGTHASPRWHLRRGHERKLPSGRTIWINSCEVGKAENGIVVKDYLVN